METGELLNTLFDPKIVSIIKLFLREEGKQYYLREIAKLTKVSPASTYRILKRLVEIQVLKVMEIKTAKLYSLESSKIVDFLKTILEVDVIQAFIEQASMVSGVEEILLLGAKEKTKANLLVVGHSIETGKLKELCADIKQKYNFTVLLMTFTKEQYEQMSAMGLYPGTKKSLYKKV